MSININTVVQVSISAESGVQSRAAFATPMIIDSQYVYGATGRVLTVTSLSGMVTAGYATYHRAYRMAQILFSQTDRPTQVKIGQWDDGTEALSAAWDAIVAADPEFYAVCLTSRTQSNIESLASQIEAASNPYIFIAESGDAAVLANSVGNVAATLLNAQFDRSKLLYNPATAQVSTLVFTGTSTAGTFTGTIDGNAISVAWNTSHAQTLTDIATAIQAVGSVATATSNGTDTITITAVSALNVNALTITANLTGATAAWSVTTAAQAPLDAAVVSILSGNNAGTVTIAGMRPKGVVAASLTSSQRSIIRGLNVSSLGTYGNGIVMVVQGPNEGKMASGARYADQQVTIDYLTLTVQDFVFAALSTGKPVPFTTNGINLVKGAVQAALTTGVQLGNIAPTGDLNDGLLGTVGFAVSVPAVSSVSDANKAARTLPDVTFQAQGAGAIQGVSINGTLTL